MSLVHFMQPTEAAVDVVALPERFDAHSTIDLLRHCSPGTSMVVDGRGVRFADRHALQSLVDARISLLDMGGDLLVAAPSVELRVTLELTGFDLLLTVVSGSDQ